MAKVDAETLAVGLGAFAGLAVLLRLATGRFWRLLSVTLLVLAAVETPLYFSELLTPLGLLPYPAILALGSTWWCLHLPSALLLGGDEILERHGLLLSTVAHLADLLLWGTLIAVVIFATKRGTSRGNAA